MSVPVVAEMPEGSSVQGVTVSLVSHGHDADVQRLVAELLQTSAGRVVRIIVTHNLPPAPASVAALGGTHTGVELLHRVNPQPKSFAQNHNAAFADCQSAYFCILNPDVYGVNAAFWDGLMQCAAQPGVACAYPGLRNEDGSSQDNERALLTPASLWKRRVMGQTERTVDWVSAACWLVPAKAWRVIGGFDESFRMYVEDAQWCLRAQLAGWRLARAPVSLIHRAQRQSSRDIKHFLWHIGSLLRLWRQPVFYAYREMRHASPLAR